MSLKSQSLLCIIVRLFLAPGTREGALPRCESRGDEDEDEDGDGDGDGGGDGGADGDAHGDADADEDEAPLPEELTGVTLGNSSSTPARLC